MRTLSTFTFALLLGALSAQITLIQDFAPLAGAQWSEYIADEENFEFELGPAGADQFWDYGSLDLTYTGESLEFLSPIILPGDFALAFTESELAIFIEEEGIQLAQYFNIQENGMYLDGIHQEIDEESTTLDNDRDLLFLPFDFTYADTREDSATVDVFVEEGSILFL